MFCLVGLHFPSLTIRNMLNRECGSCFASARVVSYTLNFVACTIEGVMDGQGERFNLTSSLEPRGSCSVYSICSEPTRRDNSRERTDGLNRSYSRCVLRMQ